jgi:hypothetical protein
VVTGIDGRPLRRTRSSNSDISVRLPTYEPCNVIARSGKNGVGSVISPPNKPTVMSLPPFIRLSVPSRVVLRSSLMSHRSSKFIVLDLESSCLCLMEEFMAKRRPRAWTKKDHAELKAHSKSKTSVSKISKILKRTVGALRQKARSLGIGLGHHR